MTDLPIHSGVVAAAYDGLCTFASDVRRRASSSTRFRSPFNRHWTRLPTSCREECLGEPRTNRELFDRLEQAGWIEPPLAGTLRDMAGFRNLLVQAYDKVDLAILRDVVEHRLDDLLRFADSVRQRLRTSEHDIGGGGT